MSKRQRTSKVDKEQAARAAARQAVYAQLWTTRAYLRAHALKDALGAKWNHADAYRRPEAASLLARFRRACARIQRLEEKALRAAGFPY